MPAKRSATTGQRLQTPRDESAGETRLTLAPLPAPDFGPTPHRPLLPHDSVSTSQATQLREEQAMARQALSQALGRHLPPQLWPEASPRFRKTLAVLHEAGVKPTELDDLVRTGHLRDILRNLVKYELTYGSGFNTASCLSGQWAGHVAPHLASNISPTLGFFSATAAIGFGAEAAGRWVEGGQLGPKYGMPIATDSKGTPVTSEAAGVQRPLPFVEGPSGQRSEAWKFWPFSITHGFVSGAMSDLPSEQLAWAYMPAGAVASLVTALHDSLAPHCYGRVVPAWLDGEKEGGVAMQKAIKDLRQGIPEALAGYAADALKGMPAISHLASYEAMTRAFWRWGAASLALSGRLAAAFVPSARYALNLGTNVALGGTWSRLVSVPQEAIVAIRSSGPASPGQVQAVRPAEAPRAGTALRLSPSTSVDVSDSPSNSTMASLEDGSAAPSRDSSLGALRNARR